MTNASRAQIDLEALARDLRHDGAARQGAKGDPLAELARIVGQDDPFRALLDARNEIGANFVGASPEPEARWSRRVEPSLAAEEPARPNPADAFDQYLASVERDMQQAPAQSADGAFAYAEPEEPYDDARALRRKSPRSRLVSVGAGIAVVAVAVTGALTYKGMQGGSTGGAVPVVQADATPMKVAPKVADGVEIPDQNRQIYDRNATGKDSGQIKIVNREEQPLDVAEAARAAGSPPANQGTTTPGNSPFEAFGEPRRVRTVAVKPEAPPAPPAPAAESEPAPSPVPTMVLPTAEPAPAPPPARPAKTIRSADAMASSVMPATETPSEAPAPVKPKPTPAPVAVKKAPQRVASLGTDGVQGSPETTQATSAQIDTTSAVGGYAVQLGVRNSAADARSALHQMQAKYSRLAGKPELIRQAEVNGKTIFRVRVGPLAKEEASSLCSAVQGDGGQCFVAKN